MANFDIAYTETNKNEGGYANNPNDHGGETFAGIARRYWPSWKGWLQIDVIRSTIGKSASTINKFAFANTVLMGLVKEFYKTNFWYVLNLQLINNDQLAAAIYDFGVNAGTGIAGKALQQAGNDLGYKLGVDGVIGAATVRAANVADIQKLYEAFNVHRKAHYDLIVKNNPSQKEFYNSWISRIKTFEA